MKKTTLYRLSKEGKMLVSHINAEMIDGACHIWKETGQKDGALIKHSPDIVDKGKASRTLEEQAFLQFNSIINKLKDKGYKDTEQEAKDNRGTDASGVVKPMLALDPKKKDKSFFDKHWLVSRKYDGVRCMIGKSNGEIIAVSRAGKDYSISARFIIEKIKPAFDNVEDGTFFDGELYVHEKSLQEISGLVRTQDPVAEHGELQFQIYDIVCDKNAKDRIEYLAKIMYPFIGKEISLCEHVNAYSWDEIKALHDEYVSDGYEGAIGRDAGGMYLLGGRDARMVKIKVFQDAEYKIIGYEEGKRGMIDGVYVMDAGANGTFKSKPVGPENCDLKTLPEQFIGKMATIRFFNLTDDGVPFCGTLKAVRDYE